MANREYAHAKQRTAGSIDLYQAVRVIIAPMLARRFPPPWTVDEANTACFIVKDHNGHALAYVYFELAPGHRTAVGRAAVKQDTRSTRWRSATVSSSPRTESIQFVSSSAAARMLVDTSLATTAMPIVAGAQPNYFLLHTRATPPK